MAIKNTGISENRLSDLDMGSVLKDSHNKELHALDVNCINGLVPESYTKIIPTLKDMGDGTKEVEFLDFYGQGTKQVSKITMRSTFQGTYEITSFPFTLQTPAGLAGKYISIYDDVGSVGVWFDLDGGNSEPSVGLDRYIEVDILTGDSADDMAQKFTTAVNSDSKFSGSNIASIGVLQSSTIGNKTDATGGNTTMTPNITDGVGSINNTYIPFYSARDHASYYIWFDYKGTGTDPALSGKTGIEIDFDENDNITTISQSTAYAVNILDDFFAEYDGKIVITNRGIGETTNMTNGNSGVTVETTTEGVNGTLVARVQFFFDSNNFIEYYERVI